MFHPDVPPFTRRLGVTARLRALAACVPHGTRVFVDVGTNHAILPIAVLRAGRAERCVAVDKSPSALADARRRLRRCRVQELVALREGNGLEPVVREGLAAAEVGAVCIAGVGPGPMVAMLEGAKAWLTSGKIQLVLNPLGSSRRPRAWLAAEGYVLTADFAVTERGRDYPILVAERRR